MVTTEQPKVKYVPAEAPPMTWGQRIGSLLGLPSPARVARVNAIWEKRFQVIPEDRRRQMLEIVRYAILAPSAHNTQPWKFSIQESEIRIFPDGARRLPIGDPDDRELYISLGCALENLILAARAAGYGTHVELFPASEPHECIRVMLERARSPEESPLFHAIPPRHTNRRTYNKQPIPTSDLRALESVPLEPGVSLVLLTGPTHTEKVAELVREGNAIQVPMEGFMEELVAWIRFNDAEAEHYGDGLAARSCDRPTVPGWFGRWLMLNLVTAAGESKRDIGRILSASAFMAVVSERNDKKAWIDVGRSFERILLASTPMEIRTAHLNQNWGRLPLQTQLQQHLGIGSAMAHVVLRMGYAEPTVHSPRRPMEQVLI